jgi:hypothetical protein
MIKICDHLPAGQQHAMQMPLLKLPYPVKENGRFIGGILFSQRPLKAGHGFIPDE